MNTSQTNTQVVAIDPVTQDFKNAVFIVSLFANLVVFTTWLALSFVK